MDISNDTPMEIAGYSFCEDKVLIWIISENQSHDCNYISIEARDCKNGKYEYIKMHKPMIRGNAIVALLWQGGYSYLINNRECSYILLKTAYGDKKIFVNKLPFVYYYPSIPREYYFLNEYGDAMKD